MLEGILSHIVAQILTINFNIYQVYVNIPKLSTRIEDWLLYPSSDANCTNSDSSYLRPRSPPYNMSEWLKTPSQKTEGSNLSSTPLEKLSTDASIKNWLYKIKQCPLEEEEDFEFVEEMSGTSTLDGAVS